MLLLVFEDGADGQEGYKWTEPVPGLQGRLQLSWLVRVAALRDAKEAGKTQGAGSLWTVLSRHREACRRERASRLPGPRDEVALVANNGKSEKGESGACQKLLPSFAT